MEKYIKELSELGYSLFILNNNNKLYYYVFFDNFNNRNLSINELVMEAIAVTCENEKELFQYLNKLKNEKTNN